MRKQKHLRSRQQYWVDFFSCHDFNIIYCKGKTNYLADILSRLHEGKPIPTDHYLKDPTDNDTESERDTTTSSQYSAMTSSKTSYSSGSWDVQDEQKMIDLIQEVEAAEQQTELITIHPMYQTKPSIPIAGHAYVALIAFPPLLLDLKNESKSNLQHQIQHCQNDLNPTLLLPSPLHRF